jgi:hypothetical protein
MPLVAEDLETTWRDKVVQASVEMQGLLNHLDSMGQLIRGVAEAVLAVVGLRRDLAGVGL